MRSEQAMLQLLLTQARQDTRIRAVYMNGSRVNPNAKRDILQDYDVVFVVTELAPFLEPGWIDRFGELLVMQEPDRMDVLIGQARDFDKHYAYLMQFADGTRIDLTLQLAEETLPTFGEDTLTRVLLDKDGLLPTLPGPSDTGYYTAQPTQALFDRCCNEFYWVLPYVAKALWRGQVLQAIDCLGYVRHEMMGMVGWYAAMGSGFQVNLKKGQEGLQDLLAPDEWQAVLAGYPPAEAEAMWQAMDTMCGLFERCAQAVAKQLGFDRNQREATNSRAFVRHLRQMPQDATDMGEIAGLVGNPYR